MARQPVYVLSVLPIFYTAYSNIYYSVRLPNRYFSCRYDYLFTDDCEFIASSFSAEGALCKAAELRYGHKRDQDGINIRKAIYLSTLTQNI